MKIVRERGVVESAEGGKAEVLMDAGAGSACAGCRACTVGLGEVRRVKVDMPEGLKAGDKVVVEVALPSVYVGILLLFVLPIVGLLAGGFLGEGAARALGVEGGLETVAVVAGIAGFGLGLSAGYLGGRKIRAGMPEPRIVEVTESEGE